MDKTIGLSACPASLLIDERAYTVWPQKSKSLADLSLNVIKNR